MILYCMLPYLYTCTSSTPQCARAPRPRALFRTFPVRFRSWPEAERARMADKGPPTSGTDEEQEAKAAFSVLRPVCVKVMRAPSLETLGELEAVLRAMQSLHPHLVDYVVLPLRMIIKRK